MVRRTMCVYSTQIYYTIERESPTMRMIRMRQSCIARFYRRYTRIL